MRKFGIRTVALLASALPVVAVAQEQAPPPVTAPSAPQQQDAEEQDGEEIVVTGQLRGAVQSDIPPEVQYSAADIRAFGVSTIADLLEQLAPQTGSARGRGGERPVMLLNGRRISSFAEIRDLPTEAIERVDILPEEVALKFGYRADQKVVNMVLRSRFRAVTTELEGSGSTGGGNRGEKVAANILKINRDKRISFDVNYVGGSGLLESERDVISRANSGLFDTRGNVAGINGGEIDLALSAIAGQRVTVAGVPSGAVGGAATLSDFAANANNQNVTDLAPYRTLISPKQQLKLNGVYSQNLSPKVGASINASFEVDQSQALLGLPTAAINLPASSQYSPFGRDVTVYRAFNALVPLGRDTKSQAAHVGFALNGDGLPWSNAWNWSLTGNYDRATSRTVTDIGIDPVLLQSAVDAGSVNPFGALPVNLMQARAADTANSTSSIGSVEALLRGPLVKLPAGDFSTSIRLGAKTSDFSSRSWRSGVFNSAAAARDSGSAQINLDLPIASRRRAVLSPIGDLSLNFNAEVEHLSDFGTLTTIGYGANWSPINAVRFIVSFTDEEGAPSAQQLANPVLLTPNQTVFDYVRGETAILTTISGGNPNLTADSRKVMKLGARLRPFTETDFSMIADYTKSTARNQISSFPAPSAAIEAAFPTRFVRDAEGRLISMDTRAINFAKAERSQLRWGFNYSVPIKSSFQKQMERRRAEYERQREEAERNGTPMPENPMAARPPRGEGANVPGQPRQGGFAGGGQGGPGGRFGPGPGGPGGPGGGHMGGPGGAGSGRINFSLYHTVSFKDQVTIAENLPVLDLLNGDATGSRGGQSRHAIEAQGGMFKDGFGFRLNARWQSGTQVFTGVTGTEKLDFASTTSVGLRLFANLGQQRDLVRKYSWLRGTRVSLSVDNLFNTHPRVSDARGNVPVSYQPDLLDPQGRVVKLSIRKLFF